MWSDCESEIDYLNYSEVSEMISDMVSDDAMLPISLGVYGTWGVGKSSILRLVRRELEADPRNLIIEFDAWLYQDFDEAKSALMTVIAKTLYEECPGDLRDTAASFYRRVNKLKVLGIVADAGALAMGIPTFGLLSKAGAAVTDFWNGKGDAEDLSAIKAAAGDVRERADGLLAPEEKRNAPEEIAAFRQEFGQLLASMERRLIVFVDNLDRCLPANAISTLEAMRLFLFLPKTAFVVAADEEMIRLAVGKHFSDPGDRHVTDYLDKLIQIPIRVPKLGLQEVRAYLVMLAIANTKDLGHKSVEAVRESLIAKLRMSWSDEPPFEIDSVVSELGLAAGSKTAGTLRTMDRLAPLLAHSLRVNGNPRIVKRMLNVIRMRSTVAERRNMVLGEAIIAKLALFERCTDEDAIRFLASAVNAAGDGKPPVLAKLESLATETVETASLPKDWQAHHEFVSDWLRLEPRLGGIDLRPAVYLSRETLPLRNRGVRLSSAARRAVEVLLKTATMNSRASRDAIGTLAPEETGAVMDELIAAMSSNPEWNKVRADFRGAVLLARSDGASASKLVEFVSRIPSPPPWVGRLMREGEDQPGGAD